ncbi:polyketide cyclase [Hymenobacter sp. BRD128]|uniref:polyketide cyclase n=1 Tax=Hymenobacter sp. BRD128 TaxID=2675878 RepID=UPI001564B08A|nr:polyketide cyclase [Hymenobacter sp. BRD128]QKG56323.1 polyketide cyclase [Hymenobacter sp. BRD128]
MNEVLRDKSFRLAIGLTFFFFGTGIIFLFGGLAQYGIVLFVLLPIVLGVALGAMPKAKYTLGGALAATLLTLLASFVPGLSGLLCIVMVLPLMVPLIFLGYVVSHLARRYRQLQGTSRLPVLVLPLGLFLVAAPTETYFTKDATATVAVRTEQVFAYSPRQVYECIKAVDTLDAPKPLLMHLDLPIPTRCVLEKEAVGGRRTCYFKGGNLSNRDFGGGTITEQITALKKGKVLEMKVIDYNLVGRKWLGFRAANYYFDSLGSNSCKLTRITIYTSVLRPRRYWQPLEVLGIRQEHEYVFNNLARDLRRRYANASQ